MIDFRRHPITNSVIKCSSNSSFWIQFLCTANLATMATTVLIGYCDYLGTHPKNSPRPIIVTGR